MIETEAQVLRCEGENAWVKIRPHRPCGACDPVHGCKSVAITRLFATAQDAYRVRNEINAAPGDLVTVAVQDGVVLLAAVWAYGLPLLLLLLGGFVGGAVFEAPHQELASIIAASLGFALGFLLLRWRQRHFKDLEPRIVASVDSPVQACRSQRVC